MSTPKQRVTRSNSVPDAGLTTSQMKKLLDENKREIVCKIKEDTQSIKSLVQTLSNRISSLESLLGATIARVDALEQRAKNERVVDHQLNDFCHEAYLRYVKRKSLVISGVPEQTTGTVSERNEKDECAVVDLVAELGIEDFQPEEVSRIGRIDHAKSRLLRIKCRNTSEKIEILKHSKKLRNSQQFRKVFINSDLTAIQRKISKDSREELKLRREAGENVIIRRGRVVTTDIKAQDFQ